MSKTAPINMRVEPGQYDLLTKAAALLHKDRSTFILDVACREAENVLLDQRLFQLNDEEYKVFEAALVAPIPEHAKLKALLNEEFPWEK
jgi:uncharacterized protein (DUF1778 family)